MGGKSFAPPAGLFFPRCDKPSLARPSIYLQEFCCRLCGDCFRPSLSRRSHVLVRCHARLVGCEVHRLLRCADKIYEFLSPIDDIIQVMHLYSRIHHGGFLSGPIWVTRIPLGGFTCHDELGDIIILKFGRTGFPDTKKLVTPLNRRGMFSVASRSKGSATSIGRVLLSGLGHIFGVTLMTTPFTRHCMGHIR